MSLRRAWYKYEPSAPVGTFKKKPGNNDKTVEMAEALLRSVGELRDDMTKEQLMKTLQLYQARKRPSPLDKPTPPGWEQKMYEQLGNIVKLLSEQDGKKEDRIEPREPNAGDEPTDNVFGRKPLMLPGPKPPEEPAGTNPTSSYLPRLHQPSVFGDDEELDAHRVNDPADAEDPKVSEDQWDGVFPTENKPEQQMTALAAAKNLGISDRVWTNVKNEYNINLVKRTKKTKNKRTIPVYYSMKDMTSQKGRLFDASRQEVRKTFESKVEEARKLVESGRLTERKATEDFLNFVQNMSADVALRMTYLASEDAFNKHDLRIEMFPPDYRAKYAFLQNQHTYLQGELIPEVKGWLTELIMKDPRPKPVLDNEGGLSEKQREGKEEKHTTKAATPSRGPEKERDPTATPAPTSSVRASSNSANATPLVTTRAPRPGHASAQTTNSTPAPGSNSVPARADAPGSISTPAPAIPPAANSSPFMESLIQDARNILTGSPDRPITLTADTKRDPFTTPVSTPASSRLGNALTGARNVAKFIIKAAATPLAAVANAPGAAVSAIANAPAVARDYGYAALVKAMTHALKRAGYNGEEKLTKEQVQQVGTDGVAETFRLLGPEEGGNILSDQKVVEAAVQRAKVILSSEKKKEKTNLTADQTNMSPRDLNDQFGDDKVGNDDVGRFQSDLLPLVESPPKNVPANRRQRSASTARRRPSSDVAVERGSFTTGRTRSASRAPEVYEFEKGPDEYRNATNQQLWSKIALFQKTYKDHWDKWSQGKLLTMPRPNSNKQALTLALRSLESSLKEDIEEKALYDAKLPEVYELQKTSTEYELMTNQQLWAKIVLFQRMHRPIWDDWVETRNDVNGGVPRSSKESKDHLLLTLRELEFELKRRLDRLARSAGRGRRRGRYAIGGRGGIEPSAKRARW